MKPTKDSLVLYKQTPALVNAAGDKLDILLPGGKTRSVREKDIFPLHPGPVPRFPELEKGAPEGQPEEAWELLQGESPSLQELAELVPKQSQRVSNPIRKKPMPNSVGRISSGDSSREISIGKPTNLI